MDSHQHAALVRLFAARRLLPWVPEHHTFIKAELAKLEVLEPKDAESYKSFYEGLMQKYMEEHPNEIVTVVPAKAAEPVEGVANIASEVPAPKKRGRKPKISLPTE